jgi:hypothetical protein
MIQFSMLNSESHMTKPPEHVVEGAPPAEGGTFSSFFHGLDDTYNSLLAKAAALEEQLDHVRREIGVAEALRTIRAGGTITVGHSSPSAPKTPRKAPKAVSADVGAGRSPIPGQVYDALVKAGKKGKTRGELIEALSISSDDKKSVTSLANALSALQRKRTAIRKDDGKFVLNT